VLRADANDLDQLAPRLLASDHAHRAAGDAKHVGEEQYERGIRGSVYGRCGESDFDGVPVYTGNLGA